MRFSIIIPTYNREEFIANTIQSIISQTYLNWELLVVDDGSTDNTKEKIIPFLNDKRIKYIYQNNSERSIARNNGVKKAIGEYICFVDSDEKLDPHHLEKVYTGINKNKCAEGVYYYDIGFVFSNKKDNYIRRGKKLDFPISPNDLFSIIIGVPQLCMPIKIAKKYNFNPNITVGEDMELLFRISEEFPIYYLDGSPTIYEIEHQNRSVNYLNYSNIKQIDTFNLMFKKDHPASKINWKLKRKKWSEVYLRACYYYCLNNSFSEGFNCIFKSLYMNPFDKFIFKINITFSILFRKNKIEKLIL
jgi:glycosyltransferase involved in cell wall biosynthesis